jgi:hypothetical protein
LPAISDDMPTLLNSLYCLRQIATDDIFCFRHYLAAFYLAVICFR